MQLINSEGTKIILEIDARATKLAFEELIAEAQSSGDFSKVEKLKQLEEQWKK